MSKTAPHPKDDFAVQNPISTSHAARTAARLAQIRREPRKVLVAKRFGGRLWMLLDSNADAREAFQCPDGVTLEEHAASMTADQLEAAAARIMQAANAQGITTP